MKMNVNRRIKKPMLITGAASVLALGGLAGSGIVSASASGSSQPGKPPSLADQIASRFHLNKNDVQTVISQNRAEHQAERQQKFENRLDRAVKDGKITSTQKTEILAKLAALKTYRESLKGKSPQEIHKLMKAQRDELRAWALQNGIPVQYVMPRPSQK